MRPDFPVWLHDLAILSLVVGAISALIIADQFPRNHRLRRLVRFAFCKRFELIDEAVTRLKGLS